MADDFEESNDDSLLSRVRESPRTVSALIIILIIAAAIYAFSGDNQDSDHDDMREEVGVTEEAHEEGEASGATTGTSEPEVVTQEELVEQTDTLPEATQTADGYTEVAQAGDGRTHLARRAATRWLSENQAGYTVTNEHRIYIEDYIQKNMADKSGLNPGDTRMISIDMITEAVASAGQLSEKQLQNLGQYTHALS